MESINQTLAAESSTLIDTWTQSDYDFSTIEATTELPEGHSPLRTTWYHKVIFITMYSGIVIFAIVGNAIVCYIVIQSPRMRTVTNFFIATLAISDMLMATLCIPFTFVASVLLNYWPFGRAMCPIVQFVQTVAVFLSTHTLVAISIDRYMAIIYPLRPKTTKKTALLAIVMIWTLSILIPLPTALKARATKYVNHTSAPEYCIEKWEKKRHSPAFRHHYPYPAVFPASFDSYFHLWQHHRRYVGEKDPRRGRIHPGPSDERVEEEDNQDDGYSGGYLRHLLASAAYH